MSPNKKLQSGDDDASHLNMLLQNHEFLDMLKKDVDFMRSLENDHGTKNVGSSNDEKKSERTEEDFFKNKLKNMNMGKSKLP